MSSISLLIIFGILPLNASCARNITPQDITDIIVLTGQSNALATHSRYESNNHKDMSDHRVFAYTDDKGWQMAMLRQYWYRAWPIGWEDSPTRNNALLHAAKEIVRQEPSRVVGIILVAEGNRKIELWQEQQEMDIKLDQHVTKALALLDGKKVNVVLWMQGEANTKLGEYTKNLNVLIARLRTKPWASDNMHFICSETKNSWVNPALMALELNQDPLTACVKASDLKTDDNIHFTSDSIRAIGVRFGDKYLEVLRR